MVARRGEGKEFRIRGLEGIFKGFEAEVLRHLYQSDI